MHNPFNVVPFVRNQPKEEEDGDLNASTILGKLCRKDFELWVCLSANGSLYLKWWRWSEDVERFYPLEDGGLTLNPSELQPLAELLASVGNRLDPKG